MAGYQALSHAPQHEVDSSHGAQRKEPGSLLSKKGLLCTIGAIVAFVAAFCTLAQVFNDGLPQLLQGPRSIDVANSADIVTSYVEDAHNHPEFEGIAEQSARPGCLTFLVDGTHVARLDDEPHPLTLYSKQGYIFVRTTRVSPAGALEREIHYWVGSDAAQPTKLTTSLKTLVLGNILRVDSDKQRHDDTESVSELFEGQPISFKHGEDPRGQSILGELHALQGRRQPLRSRRQVADCSVFVTDEELATWPEEDQTAYLDSCDALIDARLAELKNPDLYPITDNGVIIIDIGSSVFRMGYMYCTEEYPIRVPNVLALLPSGQYVYGDDAINNWATAPLRYPVRRNLIVNQADWNMMLEHVFFNVAGEDPGYRPVVLVEQAGISPAAREALFAAAFNVLKAKWVTMVPAPPLSPFLSGDQYAVVVDIGATVTTVTPIVNGNIGGANITDYFRSLVPALKTYTSPAATRDIVEPAKKELCTANIIYDLPASSTFTKDSVTFTVSKEVRRQCVEPLFNTTLVKLNEKPLPDVILQAILAGSQYKPGGASPVGSKAIFDGLLRNIVLVGGSSKFEHLDTLLRHSMFKVLEASFKDLLIPSPRFFIDEYVASDYTLDSASNMASLDEFTYASWKEFEASGPSLVHTKFPLP